jgi:hypothetical protein
MNPSIESSLKSEFNLVMKEHPELQTLNAFKNYWKKGLKNRNNLQMPPDEIFQTYWDQYVKQGGKRHSKKTRKARKTRKGTYRRRR